MSEKDKKAENVSRETRRKFLEKFPYVRRIFVSKILPGKLRKSNIDGQVSTGKLCKSDIDSQASTGKLFKSDIDGQASAGKQQKAGFAEKASSGTQKKGGFTLRLTKDSASDEKEREQINASADKNGDGSASLRELYEYYKESGLPRVDSAFNALYFHSQNKIANNRKIKRKYKNLYQHPVGWFNEEREGVNSKSIWHFVEKALLVLPNIVRKMSALPKAFGKKISNISEAFDNAFSLGTLVKKYAFSVIMLVFAVYVGSYMLSSAEKVAALELYVDGNRVGYVKSTEVYFAALDSAEDTLSNMLGLSYKIPNGTASYKVASVEKPTYLSEKEITTALMKSSEKYLSTGYGLYIDNTLVAVSGSRLVMDNIVNETVELYSELYSNTKKYKNKVLSFANNIVINEITVPKTVIKNEQEIRAILGLDSVSEINELLLRDKNADVSLMLPEIDSITASDFSQELPEDSVYYIDSAENDAASNSDSADDSHILPGADEENQEGSALLTVKTTETRTFTEVIPCEVEYIYDSDMLMGRKIVERAGVDGIKRAKYNVSYVDGKEVERELISEQTLKKPVTKRVRVGTKPADEYDESASITGTFIMPYNGTISSGFSGRTLFGAYEFHAALDIVGPLGSPILSTDGGKVVFAGNNGTYGNCVIIDHGDGIESLYAHLNSIAVEVGDRVGQGWLVGEMGRTGRVTGVHLHFEIRVNGVKQDPLDYLNN